MEDSVQVACVISNATDAAFQIYSLRRSAYAAVLRAFCAQSDVLSMGKERCLTELRNELKILQTEHAECLVKARSNKQIKSFRSSMRPTRYPRYCVSDSLLGAISICSSVKSFLCCDKPPLIVTGQDSI